MGGRNGFTLAEYGALSDRQILALLTIKWDDDGRLIGEAEERDASVEERIETSRASMPDPAALGLTDAELAWAQSIRPAVSTGYVLMFWQVWAGRGKTHEEIKKLWTDHLASDH